MARASAGSVEAAVRTNASMAAVDGVARTSVRRAGRTGKRLEQLGVWRRCAEFVGQVGLDEIAGPSVGQGRSDGRQGHRKLPFDVPILLGVGGQFTLRQGSGLPTTVEGVRKQVTPDNRLRQHLTNSLSVHGGHCTAGPIDPPSGGKAPARHNAGRAQPDLLRRRRDPGLGHRPGRAGRAAGVARGPANPDSRSRRPPSRCLRSGG